MSLAIVIHHGGKFVKNDQLEYMGGTEDDVPGQDVDRWSFFEAVGLVTDLGIEVGSYRIWWRFGQDKIFRRFVCDEDAIEMADFALKYGVFGHLFIEHFEEAAAKTEGTEATVGTEGNEEDVNEEEGDIGYIHMDDSEEERTMGQDDGFPVEEEEPAKTPSRIPQPGSFMSPGKVIINGTPYKVKSRAKRKLNKKDGGSCSAPVEDLSDLDEEYKSEELDSDGDEEDEEEVWNEPKYERFRKEELNKDYQFHVGLEFGTLDEWREAIVEWSILNGKEIRFVKNDKKRVRVHCKVDCGFKALVSRVAHKQTFRMKTWKGVHKCARVLRNQNAKSKWVAKKVNDRLKISDKVKVKEIMADIRVNFNAGISWGTAWRAKKWQKKVLKLMQPNNMLCYGDMQKS